MPVLLLVLDRAIRNCGYGSATRVAAIYCSLGMYAVAVSFHFHFRGFMHIFFLSPQSWGSVTPPASFSFRHVVG